jgi:hypothetical protein
MRTATLLAIAALSGLAILKLVMLAAIFARSEPYPPPALAPLFAAGLALSALSAALILARTRWFAVPAGIVALESLLSFGPQKFLPGDTPLVAQSIAVYPAVATGSCLIGLLIAACWRLYRGMAVAP